MSGRNFEKFVDLASKIIAVGKNYADHMKEMGYAAAKVDPVIFMKPTSAFIVEGQKIEFPPGCQNLHHEVELGVVIGKTAKKIPEAEALKYVAGYTIALDITARDLQDKAKKEGLPWTIPKGFDTSCPVGPFVHKDRVPDPQNLKLWCKVNGQTRQNGCTKDMIYSVPYLISYVSNYFTLYPGDVILTGTPAGVGPVKEGDVIEAGLDELSQASFEVAKSDA
ncbi:acylpyruvase FAHD1, mitochondrial-like [Paramacrobiotus metropolitanus]|uniref:acylpyruvase FAHD1, mitochondrial-like n=1 Tax=Paramacrobiotus metropolitanus TaxID=2943436 RepID=UPI0024464BF1|nr:acylpyruvase FAHD1, mitochondrial-like [Paramacrobiotus metropolitanus]